MAINPVIHDPEVNLLEHEDVTEPKTKRVLTYGWDATNNQKVRLNVTPDGSVSNGNYATKITESGSYTYIATAVPGTLESDAKWQVVRLDQSSGLRVTYANGNAGFTNVATDLTALTYS